MNKKLYLLRHAKTEEGRDKADRDRRLLPRGVRCARLLGLFMSQENYAVDWVYCSSAQRTQETWRELQHTWPCGAGFTLRDDLYLADAPRLRQIVADFPAHIHTAMIIGHNPGLHLLAAEFIHEDSDSVLADRLATSLPTCTLLELEFHGGDWAKIAGGKHHGLLRQYLSPEDLI
jgi:phosphohistidine phosphatase